MKWEKRDVYHMASEPEGYTIARTVSGKDSLCYSAFHRQELLLTVKAGAELDMLKRSAAIEKCKERCEEHALRSDHANPNA